MALHRQVLVFDRQIIVRLKKYMNVISEDSKVNRIGMYELKAQGLYTVYAVMPGQLKV